MSLRIRQDGRILCAAMHSEEPGDIYLHDGIHHELSVRGAVVTEAMWQSGGRGGHANHGEWWWAGYYPSDIVPELWTEEEE